MTRRSGVGGSLTDLRRANRDEVVRLLRLEGPMSQAELARRTGLSPASVSNIAKDLTKAGTAHLSAVMRNGRRTSELAVTPEAGVVVGIDFGNRHVRVAIADMVHTVLAEDYARLAQGHRAGESISRALSMLDASLEQCGRQVSDVRAISVGLPGPVSADGQVASATILPGWAHVDIAALLRARLDVPVTVDNDANLGAMAESVWGHGRGLEDFAYLKVSTGIGAGLVLNGRLYRGASGTAGEIGHTTIEEDGPLCKCGNRGCLETVAAAPALLNLLRANYGGDFSLEDLLRMSASGDVGCRRIIADAGRHIGVAVANLCNLVDPELLIVGGELAAAGDVLLNAIVESLSRRAMSVAAQKTRVITSELAERTAVLGAVATALVELDAPHASREAAV